MVAQILVPLRHGDRIKEIIPYIEEIAKPETRVIFFMRYPVDPRAWLQDHWINTESSREAMLVGRKILQTSSCDAQRQLAEQEVLLARDALSKMGVEVAVDVYTGPFREVVESYTRTGRVHLMMQAQSGLPIMRFLHRAIGFFGLFKRTSFPPVLLLRPGH